MNTPGAEIKATSKKMPIIKPAIKSSAIITSILLKK
jgi:hypothetical protein